jgi:predicted transposase YbfD/YdcC
LLHGHANFPGLRQVIEVRCQAISIRTGEVKEETRYGVASLSPSQADARTLMLLMNRHWGIENRNHHVRDDSWKEGRQVWRKGNGAHPLSTLLSIALNLLRARSPYWTAKTFLPHRADIIRDLTLNNPDAFKMVS